MQITRGWSRRAQFQIIGDLMVPIERLEELMRQEQAASARSKPATDNWQLVQVSLSALDDLKDALIRGAPPILFRRNLLKIEGAIMTAWMQAEGAAAGRARFTNTFGKPGV